MSRSKDRTEKPTERRKRESRREGKVARSQEVGVALSLLALLLSLRLLAPLAFGAIGERTRTMFRGAGGGALASNLGSDVIAMLFVALLPFLLVAMAFGVVGGVGQVGFSYAPEAVKPKLSNLSLKKGLHKFKPAIAAWELARTALKIGLLVAVIWGPMRAYVSRLGRPLGLADALDFTGGQVFILMMRATVLALVIAGADYAVTRYRTSKELKMSKQELKEDVKRQEGDALTKQVRRRRAREISRNRMIAMVGTADVLVTNPTRLAVALTYEAGEPAPRVVAKGANKLAVRIRTEAYRSGVPVIEDKPVARALYRKVKIGHFVPTALFEAVAAVLAVAYRRRRRRSLV